MPTKGIVSWLPVNPIKCLFLGNSTSLNQLTPMMDGKLQDNLKLQF